MNDMISLGVDIGGTGAKCVAFSEKGEQKAISYREYPTPPGKTDLDPEVLAEAAFQVIADCVAALPEAEAVAAVTVSSFGESFVPIDAQGRPLTDIIMYFADTGSGEFDELVRRVGEETFMGITLTKPDAFYSLSKMLHTRHVAPGPVWKHLLISGYICYRLSGETAIDVSLACRTLLFDVKKRDWSDELLAASGFTRGQMPTVLPAGTPLGPLKPSVARRLGLTGKTRVVIGAHDQVVNALACGVQGPGDAADVSGTTESIAPFFADIPPGFGFQRNNYACVPYLNAPGFVTYAYNLSGGAVVRWFRDNLASHLLQEAKAEGLHIYDLLNRQCPREPGQLILLPFLQGLGGTPDMIPQARGMMYGLSMETSRADLYRAILEGLSYEMAINLDALAEFGIVPERLYACGGGARSPVWLQIKADVWNREVIPVLTKETGALGSAILGFAAVSGEKDLINLASRFTRHGTPIQPDPKRAGFYQEQYKRYKRLRELLVQEFSGKERAI